MEKKIIISILFLSLGLIVIGQDTIKTPWGTPVIVAEQSDMTPKQRHDLDSLRATSYPTARFLPTLPGDQNYPNPSSTSTFNCHGYAWHMYWLGEEDEFDSPYIMNSSEADNYFDDPSFIECPEAEADILWINSGAHTALTTNDSDTLLSKWSTGPLAIHGKGSLDSPWPPIAPNTVKYYKKCYEEIDGVYYSDISLELCKAKYTSLQINTNVDVEIEYEDWLLIERDFVSGIGSTLYLHPE